MATRKPVYRGRNVTVYYKPDRRSIARCAVGPELTDAVHDIAGNIAKPFAIGISPRRTGRYTKSFEVETAYVAMGRPELMTRVVARLVNTDPGAAAIEYGTPGALRLNGSGPQRGAHVLGQTLAMLDATLV